LLGALPPKVLVPKGGHAMILGLGVNGDVKYNFQDSTGHVFTITSVNEFDGKLYLGSIAMHSVAVFDLHDGGQ
jgi:hypothetical protein